MPFFESRGFSLRYEDEGDGPAIMLIHGFGSNIDVNWINPGWFDTLVKAGYRVIAFDHLGHGQSDKSHNDQDYFPSLMASDAIHLLDHLTIEQASLFGYSMGARISVFAALEHEARIEKLILGGLGIALITGTGDWDVIAEALTTETPDQIKNLQGQMFRKFADQTKSDRLALAACITTSRQLVSQVQVKSITKPVLIGVGTKDDIAGAPSPLAALMPHGQAFAIEGRDHMLAVGDRSFKARVLAFLLAES